MLYVLSFNFTHLDIDHSRGFGIVTTPRQLGPRSGTAVPFRLHRGQRYVPKTDTFVVSPANARKTLERFLKGAKTQLLIYDPKVSDTGMLRILQERAKAGVEIKIIGSVAGRTPFDVQKLAGTRRTRARSSAIGAALSSAARACAPRNWTRGVNSA